MVSIPLARGTPSFRLIGAILLEQNEEWAVHCARYDNGSSRAVAR
jgi:hypothetical protein